jgi:hypothetical protein
LGGSRSTKAIGQELLAVPTGLRASAWLAGNIPIASKNGFKTSFSNLTN